MIGLMIGLLIQIQILLVLLATVLSFANIFYDSWIFWLTVVLSMTFAVVGYSYATKGKRKSVLG